MLKYASDCRTKVYIVISITIDYILLAIENFHIRYFECTLIL